MAESLPGAARWQEAKARPPIDRHVGGRLIGDPEEEGVEGQRGRGPVVIVDGPCSLNS